MNGIDRFTSSFAPRWTLRRVQARRALRHYEAAQPGRRTQGWNRHRGDVNSVTAVAMSELRIHARDLVRNNGWARKAQRIIANHSTGGWGLTPKAVGPEALAAGELWKAWADSTECESEGLATFSGIQHLVMKAIASDGEALLRRRFRRPEDGLSLPLQIQVLEADFLDTSMDGLTSASGNKIVQGVEFDKLGRRVAYWLFPTHPGASVFSSSESKRIPASEIIHVFYRERPGQVRGVSWFGAGIVPLKELDEFEDAELVRQKVAACFAAFVEEADGAGTSIGTEDEDDETIEVLEPGSVSYLTPGKKVTFSNPPTTAQDGFTQRTLRKVAASLGVTYEDLTGDYSQVNFSSARMARLSHWGNVVDWQWNMMVPQLCDGVYRWAMEAAVTAGALRKVPRAEWSTPPMPMIEPDKEGLALQRLVRGGTMTFSEMVRQQGGDPEAHWAEYAADQAKLDALGIKLDSDVRAVSQAGLTQERAGGKPEETEADRILADVERRLLPAGGES